MTERAAFVVQPEAIRSTYPGVTESAGRRPPRSEAPAREGQVQYWRLSAASTDHYFGLVNGRDFILRGDQWVPYDVYKSGPSWWRLTGEPGADVIAADDLPPDAPRGVQGR